MNSFSRRSFLKSVLCGAGLTVAGGGLSVLFAQSSSPDKSTGTTGQVSAQFEKARIHFRKKEYMQAEQLYKEILTALPTHISIYDCYKKLLAHQNRTTEIIPYYKKAIEKYPQRVDFYDHLAKTYREIVTGNKKLEKSLCLQESENDLIQTAIGWHEKAIGLKPEKKFLYLSLLDTLYARNPVKRKSAKQTRSNEENTGIPPMTDQEKQLTEPYLQEWFYRKYPHSRPKARIVSGTESSIQTRIYQIQNKERAPLYTTSEIESRAREIKLITKKLNVQLHEILHDKNDLTAMTALAIEVLQNNPDETEILGTTKKYLKKAGRWDLQCRIYDERVKNYKDFWTQCMAAKANIHNGAFDKALSQFIRLSNTPIRYRNGKKTDMLYRGLCDCMIAKNDMEEAKNQLIKGINATCGLGGASTALLLKYARCLCMQGKSHQAIELLRKRLDPSYQTDISDPMLTYIAPDMSTSPELFYLHQFYNKDKTVHAEEKVSILCAIAKIQKENSDTGGLERTCNEIEALIPSYPFIKNIKSLP